MSEMEQGLMVSFWGLATTFIAIGLLVVVIILLDKAFPAKNEEGEEAATPEPGASPSIVLETSASEAEVAAAITAALYVLREREALSGDLGRALEAGHGPWWTLHRTANATIQSRRFEK